MAALSARETIRYGVRLVGYLLVTTILSGALVAGGIGIAYVSDPAVVPGGAAPDSYVGPAVGGIVAFLGILLFVAGLFAVAFVTITDAVRLGVDRSSLGPDPSPGGSSSSSEAPEESGAEPSEADDDTAESAPEESSDDPLAGGSDPFADSDDPFEEPDTSDPLAGPSGGRSRSGGDSREQSGSAGGQRRAGPTRQDDDEAWRREIEAKLDEEDDARAE